MMFTYCIILCTLPILKSPLFVIIIGRPVLGRQHDSKSIMRLKGDGLCLFTGVHFPTVCLKTDMK